MTRSRFMGMMLCICVIKFSYAQIKAPASFDPVSSANQMRWQKMEYYSFVHFSLNTYTDHLPVNLLEKYNDELRLETIIDTE